MNCNYFYKHRENQVNPFCNNVMSGFYITRALSLYVCVCYNLYDGHPLPTILTLLTRALGLTTIVLN